MLNKKLLFLLFAIVVLGITSCKEKTYLGESYTNYADLTTILKDTWDQEEPLNYTKVTLNGTEKDSASVPQDKMPWAEINELFEKANFHKESLDKHYTINVMLDSANNTQTLFYETLEPEDFTQSLNIVSHAETNELNNIYIKTKSDGFQNAESINVLYIPQELIQIHKKGKAGNLVETYYFPM